MPYDESKDPELWNKCVKRASWLLNMEVDIGIPEEEKPVDHVDIWAEKIYNTEIERIRAGEESLFTRQNVIPDLPDEESTDNN